MQAETPVKIEYYSDVLCVWAWVAQRRLEEMLEQFGDQITISYHCVDIFGDVQGKIATQWSDRGGFDGFRNHVVESAAAYENAPVNKSIWEKIRPVTSANAHLIIKAASVVYDEKSAVELALSIRKAFFLEAKDISNLDVLYSLALSNNLDSERIKQSISEGSAIAALMADYQKSRAQGIKGSPSYVMSNGRQTLYGNVGYRVLHANIEELLKKPEAEACWC